MKIISGGQTGVDRGALDAAIDLGIAHGGTCPRGRLAEDGTIPLRYHLEESESAEYRVRTERNVLQSDGTLILHGGRLAGGTELTWRLAAQYGKPCLVIDLCHPPDVDTVRRWLVEHQVETLNVAGPRESQCPGIGERAKQFVRGLILSAGLPAEPAP